MAGKYGADLCPACGQPGRAAGCAWLLARALLQAGGGLGRAGPQRSHERGILLRRANQPRGAQVCVKGHRLVEDGLAEVKRAGLAPHVVGDGGALDKGRDRAEGTFSVTVAFPQTQSSSAEERHILPLPRLHHPRGTRRGEASRRGGIKSAQGAGKRSGRALQRSALPLPLSSARGLRACEYTCRSATCIASVRDGLEPAPHLRLAVVGVEGGVQLGLGQRRWRCNLKQLGAVHRHVKVVGRVVVRARRGAV